MSPPHPRRSPLPRSRLALLALALTVTGCAWVEYETQDATPRPPRPLDAIELIVGATPRCAYTTTGILQFHRGGGVTPHHREAIEAIREEAAARGLDGVHSLDCLGAEVNDEGPMCIGMGFICD